MKLVFFGGVQGVGKSTLLAWLDDQFNGKITLLNPGELFRQYFYCKRLKTIDEIEDMIVQEIERTPADAVVVVHWHYAVLRPEGFIPQITFERLTRVAHTGNLKGVALLSVEASTRTIYERRLKDYDVRKRELGEKGIGQEINADREFLTKQRSIFTEALGEARVTELLVLNEDLTAAQTELYKFFTLLFDSEESA